MIKQTEKGVLLEVKVKPNSKRFALVQKGDQLILEVTSAPKEGKANMEIVSELKKMFGKEVEILRGFKSRDKLILINDLKKEKLENLL